MLPHVQQQDGDLRQRQVALLVEQLHDVQPLTEGVVDEHGPAGALDGVRVCLELSLELVEAAEELIDRGTELAVRLVATVGGHVRPEHGVVDVASEVEGEILLQLVDAAERAAVASLGELVERRVDALDVGRMVLRVVQLHDLARDVRRQCAVVVRKIRKVVRRHLQSSRIAVLEAESRTLRILGPTPTRRDSSQVMVMEKVRSAKAPWVSVARTVKVKVPGVVGVPVIRPGLGAQLQTWRQRAGDQRPGIGGYAAVGEEVSAAVELTDRARRQLVAGVGDDHRPGRVDPDRELLGVTRSSRVPDLDGEGEQSNLGGFPGDAARRHSLSEQGESRRDAPLDHAEPDRFLRRCTPGRREEPGVEGADIPVGEAFRHDAAAARRLGAAG